MASKYARRMVVPDDFPETLKGFTREVLRSFPGDLESAEAERWILNFGAQYFAEKANADPAPGYFALDGLSPDELRERVTAIFLAADTDSNGHLDHDEFRGAFKTFATDLGFSAADIRRIMAEADVNDDGRIEYHEFVPLAVNAIEMVLARRQYAETKADREEKAHEQSKQYLLHGMDRSELEATLNAMFNEADADGSGVLSRAEFSTALRNCDLGLTRKEINVLMHEVDANADGNITYSEFLPLCFNLLVEIVADEFANHSSSVSADEVELAEFFTDLFASADMDGTGKLRASKLAELLHSADLGLSALQLSAVMAEAEVDDDGNVAYAKLAKAAAAVVAAIIQVQMNPKRAEALVAYRATGSGDTVLGMSQQEFEAQLSKVIAGADTDGSGRVHFQDALQALDSLGLQTKQSKGIVHLAGIGSDNTVDIAAVSHQAFKLLQQMAEHERIFAGEV